MCASSASAPWARLPAAPTPTARSCKRAPKVSRSPSWPSRSNERTRSTPARGLRGPAASLGRGGRGRPVRWEGAQATLEQIDDLGLAPARSAGQLHEVRGKRLLLAQHQEQPHLEEVETVEDDGIVPTVEV